jgi:hypothetical protein
MQFRMTLRIAEALFSTSLCGQQVQINNTQNQETVAAMVADECLSCNARSLELSEGAFQQIDSGGLSVGVVPSACRRLFFLVGEITDSGSL